MKHRTVNVDLRAFFPPAPKFQIGDFARHGYGKEKGIVKIGARSYVPYCGWVYSHTYRPNFGGSGGGCGSPGEEEYIALTDPLDKLRAALTARSDKKKDLEWHVKKLAEEIRMLEFSLAELGCEVNL